MTSGGGPFWALHDGNEALREFGKRLRRVYTSSCRTLPPGRYIEWSSTQIGHFLDREVLNGEKFCVGDDTDTVHFEITDLDNPIIKTNTALRQKCQVSIASKSVKIAK